MASDVFGIVGATLAGAFHVEAVVAEGGFGVVYRAYHSGFRAPVALKCLKIPQYLGAAEQSRFEQQFQAEAELLFKLSASIPTVVRPLHVETITAPDGSFMPFLALEWLDGETLDALVKRREAEGRSALTLKQLIRLLNPAARALDRAHKFQGPEGPVSIVHRDMKPENIFLAKVAGEKVVKILDFGIGKAKSVASQVAGHTSQGEADIMSFTPAYGAPEQWVPKRYGQTGPWTDVWGLALTLVELLARRPIIEGDQAAMMGTVLDTGRRPTPGNEGLEVSPETDRVFLKALAVDPRERYSDVSEFWRDLVQSVGLDERAAASRLRTQSGSFSAYAEPARGRVADPRVVELGAAKTVLAVAAPDPSVEVGAAERVPPSRAAPIELDVEPGTRPVDRARLSSGAGSSAVSPMNVASSVPVEVARQARAAKAPVHDRGSSRFSSEPRLSVGLFIAPALLIVAGIVVTWAAGLYAESTGKVLRVGPVRPAWLAGALVLSGIVLLALRLLRGDRG